MDDFSAVEKRNDTYILDFSTASRTLISTSVSSNHDFFYDSSSGFTLYISKDVD